MKKDELQEKQKQTNHHPKYNVWICIGFNMCYSVLYL